MHAQVRKVVRVTEELLTEVGRAVDTPTHRVAVAAVISNPWRGEGYVIDLQPVARQVAAQLARILSDALMDEFVTASRIQSIGKGVIVGEDGETEHGSALIHTPFFADLLRARVGGTAVISSAEHRAIAGTPLVVPLCHKQAAATRSHYQGMEIRIADAPRPDEIVVTAAASSGPRPNARIGDRTTDPPIDLADLEGSL
jgi:hypothetical protein